MVLGTIDIIIPNGVLLCISKKRQTLMDEFVKKCSRQKTVVSIGWLDELEKQYDDPIAYFTKRVAQLNEEKQKKQAPINFTFYCSDSTGGNSG